MMIATNAKSEPLYFSHLIPELMELLQYDSCRPEFVIAVNIWLGHGQYTLYCPDTENIYSQVWGVEKWRALKGTLP
jgi:hypothetical protein